MKYFGATSSVGHLYEKTWFSCYEVYILIKIWTLGSDGTLTDEKMVLISNLGYLGGCKLIIIIFIKLKRYKTTN